MGHIGIQSLFCRSYLCQGPRRCSIAWLHLQQARGFEKQLKPVSGPVVCRGTSGDDRFPKAMHSGPFLHLSGEKKLGAPQRGPYRVEGKGNAGSFRSNAADGCCWHSAFPDSRAVDATMGAGHGLRVANSGPQSFHLLTEASETRRRRDGSNILGVPAGT